MVLLAYQLYFRYVRLHLMLLIRPVARRLGAADGLARKFGGGASINSGQHRPTRVGRRTCEFSRGTVGSAVTPQPVAAARRSQARGRVWGSLQRTAPLRNPRYTSSSSFLSQIFLKWKAFFSTPFPFP